MTVSGEAAARELYEAMVAYAQSNGLRREERGSGWWWSEDFSEEMMLGLAVEELLSRHIDTREAVPGEIEEFWG